MFLFLLFLIFIDCGVGKGVKLYIYDLPWNTIDTWPLDSTTLAPHTIYNRQFRLNNGAGPLIDADSGMFGTWQFSSFKLIYNRMLRSPMRTLNPDEADVFFIPYDGGMDATVSAWDGRLLKARCPRSGVVAKYLHANSTYLKRKEGRDHFIVFSVIQGVSSLSSPGCRKLYHGVCKHCRKLSIEISYHKSSSPPGKKTSIAYLYDPSWLSIPYPSSYHFWERSKVLPWKTLYSNTDIEAARTHSRSNWPGQASLGRNITAIFVGGSHTQNDKSNAIRHRLKKQCMADTSGSCMWIQLGKAGHRYEQQDILSLYRRSVFCLSPPGDSPTRKGIFDALLAGCIPVVNDPFTLGDQYTWHISREDVPLMSAEVDPHSLDFMAELRSKYDFDRIVKMQKRIEQIGMQLQYSLPPAHSSGIWSPPYPDAVDLIVTQMARKGEGTTLHS